MNKNTEKKNGDFEQKKPNQIVFVFPEKIATV